MALSRRRHHHLSTLTAFFFLLFFSASAAAAALFHKLGNGDVDERERGYGFDRFFIQRRLMGPGSSPPSCRSKCGWCSPCRPVHVPIQPGLTMPLEYYPEAWRCKCGNKLFMP